MNADGAFVGRLAELAVVRSALSAGEPTKALLVSGEAGIGKSRLIREATRHETSVCVLQCACLPLTVDMPLLPVADALRTALAIDRDWVIGAVGDCPAYVLDAVSRVLPELAEQTPDLPPMGDAWWLQRLMTGIRSLLAAMARTRPMCVVIEDVHWADSTTLDFLELSLADPGHRWVMTWRSDDPTTPTASEEWRRRIARLTTVHELALSALSKQDTAAQLAELTGRRAEMARVDEIFRRGQGNPLFTEQLATVSDGAIPRQLERLVANRITEAGTTAQDVAHVLAVIGRRTTLDVLVSIIPSLDSAAIRELRDARMLHSDETAGLMLRHALLADAVLADMLPDERVRLHRHIAQVLETDATPNAGELAEHWRQAGDATAELHWRRVAADQAEVYSAPTQRAVHLLRAIELVEPRDWPTLARLYAQADEALTNANQPAAAAALAERSVEALAGAEPAVRMLALARVAQHRGVSDPDAGMKAFAEALAILDSIEPGPEAVWFLSRYANLAILTSDYALAAEVSRRGLDLAADESDPGPRKRLYATKAAAARYGGNIDDVMPALREMGAVGPTLNPTDDIFCASFAATILDGTDEEEEGIRLSEEALTRWISLGLPEVRGTAVTRSNIAQFLLDAGRVAEAATWLEPYKDREPERDHVLAHVTLSELDLARGRTDAARSRHALLEGFVPLPQWYAYWAEVGIEITSQAGEHQMAWQQVRTFFERLGSRNLVATSTPSVLALAARVAADLADQDPARRADLLAELLAIGDLQGGDSIADSADNRLDAAELELWQAELGRLEGTHRSEPWQAAAEAFTHARRPLKAAYCLWHQANALLHASRHNDDARVALVEAGRLAVEHVPLMTVISDTAKRARITLGPAAAASATTDPDDPLTVRERDVLRLVAEGLTNSEIAGRLFISPKTASVHVSNVMRKLGAVTRTQAATFAQRRGLID